jgi:protein-ribulosamine 3-kinase
VNASPWTDICAGIHNASGRPFAIESRTPIGGGCINQCYRVAGSARAFFVKINSPEQSAMFEAEAAGLAEIAASATIRVPAPVCAGSNAQAAWLVLEYVDFGEALPGSMALLGRALAALHRVTAENFGWSRDNTIGATPQRNTQTADWISFFRECRLGFQLDLARRKRAPPAIIAKGEQLMSAIAPLFSTYDVTPALLHGDLWSGNAGFDRAGEPVVFDPAVYYGDREADLAMTELFGGFSAEFYAAYRDAFPLDAGYGVRKHLYNLYHVLNHYNLFGGGYAVQAETLIDRVLAEL